MHKDQIKNTVYKYITMYHDMLDENIKRVYVHINNEFECEDKETEALGFVEVDQFGEAHIWFNGKFCDINPEKEVKDLIIHELAHLFTPVSKKHGYFYNDHGKKWKEVVMMMGGNTQKWI